MNKLQRIKKLLDECHSAQRRAVFLYLRRQFPIHPLEARLATEAEIILEAIDRAGGLTLRMIRGVIAEAAFRTEVVTRLRGWQETPVDGHRPYDFLLTDSVGPVRVQVKLLRSKQGRPMQANEAHRSFPADMYAVETQKTRAGTNRKTGGSTRPYRFGEFDLLAVAMHPVTKSWASFLFTVAAWLLPSPTDAAKIRKFQPVPATPTVDWSDSFRTAVQSLRSGIKKTIRGEASLSP